MARAAGVLMQRVHAACMSCVCGPACRTKPDCRPWVTRADETPLCCRILVLQGDWRRWRALCVAASLRRLQGVAGIALWIHGFGISRCSRGSTAGLLPDRGDSPGVRSVHGQGLYMHRAWIRAPGVGCRHTEHTARSTLREPPPRRRLFRKAPPPEAPAVAEAAVEAPVSGGAAVESAGRCGSRRRDAACFGRRRHRKRRALRKPPSRRRLFLEAPPPEAPAVAEAAVEAPVSGGAAVESAGRCGSRRRGVGCFGRRRHRKRRPLRKPPRKRRLFSEAPPPEAPAAVEAAAEASPVSGSQLPQLHRCPNPQHHAWGHDRKLHVRDFRLPKVRNFRLPLTRAPSVTGVWSRNTRRTRHAREAHGAHGAHQAHGAGAHRTVSAGPRHTRHAGRKHTTRFPRGLGTPGTRSTPRAWRRHSGSTPPAPDGGYRNTGHTGNIGLRAMEPPWIP